MENQDNFRKANTIAQLIRVVGILFFIASGLGVMRWSYAVLAGIACFLVAPAIRQFLVVRS